MNKARLEALSDGVFSIVMTLLIFDIKVPILPEPVTNGALWQELAILSPHILVYAGTFIVLSVMWINHHFLFQSFAKKVDRYLNLTNLLYLMFVAFVPFSASFMGQYYTYQSAVVLYGLNILVITGISVFMTFHIKRTQGTDHLSMRLINQARFRSVLSISCYVFGIAISFVNPYASLFFYIFPVVFNFVPGLLNFTEHIFGFDLGED